MKDNRSLSYGDSDPDGEYVDKITNALRKLKEPPWVTIDNQGNPVVQLGDEVVRLTAIREVLRLRPNLLDELERGGIRLGWTLVPDRAQLPDPAKSGIVAQQFDELRNRQWIWANFLYSALLDGRAESLPAEPANHTTERIFRVIAAIGQALRSMLPLAIKSKGEGFFVIYRDDHDCWRGYWEMGDRDKEEVADIDRLMSEEIITAGGLASDTAGALGRLLIEQLQAGQSLLPGFSVESKLSSVRLYWKRARMLVE